jgi:hypothetical protein
MIKTDQKQFIHKGDFDMKTIFKILIAVSVLFFAGIVLFSLNLMTTDSSANEEIIQISSNASIPYYTYSEMKEKSDLIVYGTVVEISNSKWSTSDGKQPKGVHKEERITEKGEKGIYFTFDLLPNEGIYTDMTFLIEECYKGNITKSEKIIIRSFGGTVGEFKMNDVEALNPEDFKEGEKLVLYLTKDATGTIKDVGPEHYVILTPRGKLSFNGEVLINADGEKVSLNETQIGFKN